MSGEHTDPRVHLYAQSFLTPGGTLTIDTPWLPLRSDRFGNLWVSIGDPIDGLAVDIDLLNPTVPETTLPSRRVLMTGAVQLVADVAGSEFSIPERGYLNSDTLAATRVAQLSSAALSGWNPATAVWNRARVLARGVDISSPNFDAGILATAAGLYLSNAAGTIQSQMLSADTSLETFPTSASNWLRTVGVQYSFDGAGNFRRLGNGSAANLGTMLSDRAALTTEPGEWTITSAPAAGVVASATRGQAIGRNVLKSINATLVGVAAEAAPILVVVRDGASGAGAILWQDQLFAPAAGSSDRVTLTGLNIVGSLGTPMTVEFVAAPGATNFEALSATGYGTA